MQTYIALLRAVNVGGHNRLAMADLRTLFSELGFESVQTLLQTGNVVFRSSVRGNDELARILEEGARADLDLQTDFFVRSAKELETVVQGNPFGRAAETDPSKLAVVFLASAPTTRAVRALQSSISGPEQLRTRGRHAYVVYPEGMGRSRLTGAVIERALATRGTARNWKTIVKLHAASS